MTHLRSCIPLTNFRGIEISHFALVIARLALVIAEFQCDEHYLGKEQACLVAKRRGQSGVRRHPLAGDNDHLPAGLEYHFRQVVD